MSVLLLVGVLSSLAVASDETQIVRFADQLAASRQFKEAGVEYRRAISYFPTLESDRLLNAKLLSALLNGRQADQALELGRSMTLPKKPVTVRCLGIGMSGRALYALENYRGSAQALAELDVDCSIEDRERFSYWEALADLRYESRDAALSALHDCQSSRCVALRTIAEQWPPSRKSPGLAAGLNAVLPGAGYAYADAPQTAVAAFLTNALFIGATVVSIKQGQNGAGIVLGLAAAGFYFGGVAGGRNAAARYNRAVEDRIIGPLEID